MLSSLAWQSPAETVVAGWAVVVCVPERQRAIASETRFLYCTQLHTHTRRSAVDPAASVTSWASRRGWCGRCAAPTSPDLSLTDENIEEIGNTMTHVEKMRMEAALQALRDCVWIP